MNEKNSKWKVFVVAFVLVFAGFAAMMATPTVLAQDSIETTGETILELDEEEPIIGPEAPLVNTEATYEANTEGTIVSYEWEILMDEDVIATGDEETITHIFGTIGPHYTVRLTVEDDEGNFDEAEMAVTATYNLEVTVSDSETDDPIEGARVVIEYPVEVTLEDTTDEDGIATFEGLTTDEFTMSITEYRYKTVYGIIYDEITADDAPAGIMEVEETLEPREEFPIFIGPVVEVIEDEDMPIEGAAVTLTHEEGPFSAETGTDGIATVYSTVNPLETSFGLEVTHDDFQTYTSELEETNEYGRIALEDRINTFYIGPVVDDVTDEPIEEVKITVTHLATETRYTDLFTDDSGEYVLELPGFEDISEHSFGVTFEKYGYETKTRAGEDAYVGTETGEVRLTPLDEFVVLVGPVVERVNDEDFPLQGAHVSMNHDDIDELTEQTGTDGRVNFYVPFDPRQESFDLEVNLDGYRTLHTSFTGTESGRLVMEEEPITEYEVEIGPVRDQHGAFVEGAWVTLFHEGVDIGTEYTDEAGYAMFIVEVDPEGTEFSYEIGNADIEEETGTFTGAESGEISVTREEEPDPEPEEYDLTITIQGDGTTNPAAGTHTYEEGSEVTITTSPDDGWRFRRWTGDVSTTRSSITITIDEDTDITAVFEEEPEDPDDEISTAMLAGIGLIVIIIIIIIAVMMMKKGAEAPMEEEFEEEEELFEEDEFGEEEELFEEEDELFGEEEEFEEEEELFEDEEEELFEEDEFEEEEELFDDEEEELFEEEE